MDRKLVSSGSAFEPTIGFSRAVRVGPHIAVAGTAPIAPDGGTACPGDLYGQAKRCLEIIEKAVNDAGGKRKHIIRTRIFLKDMENLGGGRPRPWRVFFGYPSRINNGPNRSGYRSIMADRNRSGRDRAVKAVGKLSRCVWHEKLVRILCRIPRALRN